MIVGKPSGQDSVTKKREDPRQILRRFYALIVAHSVRSLDSHRQKLEFTTVLPRWLGNHERYP